MTHLAFFPLTFYLFYHRIKSVLYKVVYEVFSITESISQMHLAKLRCIMLDLLLLLYFSLSHLIPKSDLCQH